MSVSISNKNKSMYISPSEVQKAVSVRESRGSLFREVITVEDMIDSTEINEAEECLKCGSFPECHHMESQRVDDMDNYWLGVLAEKNENRHL